MQCAAAEKWSVTPRQAASRENFKRHLLVGGRKTQQSFVPRLVHFNAQRESPIRQRNEIDLCSLNRNGFRRGFAIAPKHSRRAPKGPQASPCLGCADVQPRYFRREGITRETSADADGAPRRKARRWPPSADFFGQALNRPRTWRDQRITAGSIPHPPRHPYRVSA